MKVGWDTVTGVGTPNAKKFADAFHPYIDAKQLISGFCDRLRCRNDDGGFFVDQSPRGEPFDNLRRISR
jgi:hypothetical protein